MVTSGQLDEARSVDLSELQCLVSLLPDGPLDMGPDVTALAACC